MVAESAKTEAADDAHATEHGDQRRRHHLACALVERERREKHKRHEKGGGREDPRDIQHHKRPRAHDAVQGATGRRGRKRRTLRQDGTDRQEQRAADAESM